MSVAAAEVGRLRDVLAKIGEETTAQELADLLWLAARLPVSHQQTPRVPVTRPATLPPPIPPAPQRSSLPPSRSELRQSATAPRASTSEGAMADLYPTQAGVTSGTAAARAIRSPGAPALPGSMEIARSLRPLKRRVPSRSRMVLDETATAHRIADTREWLPVLRPAPERWLDVTLLVEESSSMIIWRQTLLELQRLLQRQGAFRNVDVLGFTPGKNPHAVDVYTGTGAGETQTRYRRPATLTEPLGRRLIVVVSDCVSPIWRNGAMSTLLHTLGQASVTTILQVLPANLWPRTGLRTFASVYARSPAPGVPNSILDIEWNNYRPKSRAARGTAVPVVSLQAQSLEHLARAIAGNSNLWIPAVFAMPVERSRATDVEAAEAPASRAAVTSPKELVRIFYGTASPMARRLASILAAAPLTLPLIRLAQRALLPESRQVHLAEVWLSGLIERPAQTPSTLAMQGLEFFFVNGVRELLLNNLRLCEVLDVLQTVSRYVGERLGQPLDFGALIADPGASGNLQIASGYHSFARVAASALRKFGGQYADLASRLEVSVYGESARETGWQQDIHIDSAPEPAVEPAARNRSKVKVRALLIGVDQHASTEISSLAGARNDVMVAREWLTACGVSAADIVVLTDRSATKAAVMDAMRQCASQVQAGDQVFFHFSGNDQPITSSDPHEADGLEETLIVYDSRPGERPTLLTHQELAEFASDVERHGGQAILFLDTCHAASGLLARRALQNTLVFAAAAEAEFASEHTLSRRTHGAATYFLAEAMRAYRPEMTWLDAYDQVLAQARSRNNLTQTPQLIGHGDLVIFGSARRPVPPYLVVTRSSEHEIEVHAASALFPLIGARGARLEIHPPGSSMDQSPIGFARITRQTDRGFAAVLDPVASIPLASRARIVDYGDELQFVRVHLPDEMLDRTDGWSLVTFDREGPEDFSVELTSEGSAVLDQEGIEVWREPSGSDVSPVARDQRLRSLFEHMAAYVRTFVLENPSAESQLTGKVDLELNTAAVNDVVMLPEAHPLMLKLRNRASDDLYISVWMLDDCLGVQRIFPATTSCVLLGKGREISLAVALRPDGATEAPTRFTFKVFASIQPADMSLLALPPLNRSFDMTHLIARAQSSAATSHQPTSPPKPPHDESQHSWVAGGPVAETAKKWPTGMTLRIRFLDGEPRLQRLVRTVATEWTQYANLKFEFVRNGDAQLRVSFKQDGSWSYMGTDALSIPEDEPTINFGDLNASSDLVDIRRTVLHEFGHALGLDAAQRSPISTIPWNKKAAYQHYGKLGWDRETVRAQVFGKLDPRQATHGPPDPHSIMYHPVAKEAIDGKTEIHAGDQLSEGDKKFIAELYPPTEPRS